MKQIAFVVGFLFDAPKQHILLLVKSRPAWQAGKLNGPGGLVKEGEQPIDAIRREYREETGLLIENWKHFATLKGISDVDWAVHFFYAVTETLKPIPAVTDEAPVVVHLDNLAQWDTVNNLRWLIEMALSIESDRAAAFVIQEQYC